MAYEQAGRTYRQDTDNTARAYLQEYPALYQRHAALVRELARLREVTTRATGRIDALPIRGTPGYSGNEDAMLQVVAAERELEASIARLAASLTARLRLVERIPDELQRTILTLRYINGMDWEQIGYKLHYERTQLYEHHSRALLAANIAMAAHLIA